MGQPLDGFFYGSDYAALERTIPLSHFASQNAAAVLIILQAKNRIRSRTLLRKMLPRF